MRICLVIPILVCACVAISTTAHTATCSDIVVDEMSAISNKVQVVDAAQRLAHSAAVEVRVRAVSSRRGAKNIDDFEQTYRAQCPEWLSSNGKLRSSVLLFLYVDDRTSPQWVGVYYGSGFARLDNEWRRIIADRFIQPMEAFRHGDKEALTPAFTHVLDDFREIMVRSTSTPTPVIVHQNSVDYSGVLRGFLWIIVGCVVIGGIAVAVLIFFRVRDDRGGVRAAQQRARAIFADCVGRIQQISSTKQLEFNLVAAEANLSARDFTKFQADLKKVDEYAASARGALSRFLPDQEKDPNPNGLSASAYTSNEQACEDMIVHFVEPAEELVRTVDTATTAALAGTPASA